MSLGQISILISQEVDMVVIPKIIVASCNHLTCCCFGTPCRNTVIIVQMPKTVLLMVNTVQGLTNMILVYGDHAMTPSKAFSLPAQKY